MPFDGRQIPEDAATLMRAKQYLQENGWVQGWFGLSGGRRCVIGAIFSVFGTEVFPDALRKAERLMGDCLPLEYGTIVCWNDALDRTVEEVYALFDCAIALALTETAVS